MSLISDALKEAQRSHSQRSASKGTASGEAFFPYPEDRASPQRSRNLFLIVGSSVIVIAIAAAVIVKVRHRPATPRLPIVPATHVAANPTPQPPSGAAVASPPASAPAAGPGQVQPHEVVVRSTDAAAAPAAQKVVSSVPSASVSRATGTPTATIAQAPAKQSPDSVASRPETAASSSSSTPAPPALAVVSTQAAGGGGVHVVVDPSSSRAGDSLFKQAYAEQIRGNFERSKELYERAIAQPQASSATFNNYGVLLLQNGNQLGASEMFKQALNRNDKNVDAWINLGDAYNAIGHHAEAMSAYARAAQLDASNPSVKIRLAAEYQAIGDTASARRMFDDAVKQAPKDPTAHYKYGMFLQAQRDYAGAVREYQSFVDLAPGKYSAENIAMIRQYIVTLGRYVP